MQFHLQLLLSLCAFSPQDGINFDRNSMIRVRRTIDAAAANVSGAPGLFDLHAGIGGPQDSPPALEYMSHLPFMNGGK